MERVYSLSVDSPLGLIELSATERGLSSVKILGEFSSGGGVVRRLDGGGCDVLKRAACELNEYFAGWRREFTVDLDVVGSGFDVAVWSALRSIPYGEVRSYRWLSEQIGYPRAYRAVGRALGRNPLPIFLPCHRVVRSDGGLAGYSAGLRIKRLLLRFEKEGRLDSDSL